MELRELGRAVDRDLGRRMVVTAGFPGETIGRDR